jgi:hypothetical protein
MKKIITTIAFIALCTVSAKAVDFSVFSITGGLAANQGVFGATATEKNDNQSGNNVYTDKESGVFTDSYTSQFIELGIGQFIAIGFEHTPDSVSTPQNVSREGGSNPSPGKNTVSVDFNDLNTTYVKLNLPILDGLYVKSGIVSTDLDIKESMGSGSTYRNVDTDGTMIGAGYSRYLGESNLGIRFETSYLELDDVKTDNGVAQGTAYVRSIGRSHNGVSASNLEGLQAKIALTYTFGKN